MNKETNFMQTALNSHSWTDFEMLLRFLEAGKNVGGSGATVDLDYLIIGLKNSIARATPDASTEVKDEGYSWNNIEQAYIIGVMNNGRSLIENFPQEVSNHKAQLELLRKYFDDNKEQPGTVQGQDESELWEELKKDVHESSLHAYISDLALDKLKEKYHITKK